MRGIRSGRVGIGALLVLALAACTFDPLAGWQAPRGGRFSLGDAIVAGDADVGQYELLPPPFRVHAIEPERGDPAGDEPVVITGVGFVSGMEVFFDDAPGAFVQAQDGERLFLRTPPGEPGRADLRVVHPDGREERLNGGFLYGRPVQILEIVPDRGPAEGGSPVTVYGTGFLEDTTLVVGGRLLISLERLDDTSLIGITAGGAPGPADVIATNLVGASRLRGGFRYEAPLAIHAAAPPIGAMAGGETVTIAGTGLSRDAQISFRPSGGEPLPASLVGWDEGGTRLQIRSPAGPAGAADLIVSVPGQGSAVLAGGYSWRPGPPEGEPLTLLSLHPAQGATAGGEAVLAVATGLTEDEAPRLLFAGQEATLLDWDAGSGLLSVRTPPGDPGPREVVLAQADSESRRPGAFLYRASVAVYALSPPAGSHAGGTPITIRGEGFGPGAFVRFGALPAAEVTVVDEQTLRCLAPPGAPGLVDVVVGFSDPARAALPGASYRLTGAFEYLYGGTALFAMSPTRGSVAGGTYVELYGAEMPARPLVRFGHWQATEATRISPSKMIAYSPMVTQPGALDVAIVGPGGTDILPWGYTYFDPRGTGPVTWGEPVDGAVNVTIIDSETLEPIAGAFTMLGERAETPYRARTNLNGQATLSGPALSGAQLVTGVAPAYNASTLVEVDAENVIVALRPDEPQGQGGGGGGGSLPPGRLAGAVDSPDKYVPIPVASCDDIPADSEPLCRPCVEDADCAAPDSGLLDLACTDLARDGWRCTSACGEGCPAGFSCAPVAGGARCVPSLGERLTRCEVTRRSPFWYSETAGTETDPYTGVFLLDSRLGDVAVVCLGGYEEWETGQFVATRMGVRRHAYAESDRLLAEQDVKLDIPLERTVLFRLDPALAPPGEPSQLGFQVSLDLGSDGVYVLADDLRADAAGLLRLERTPEAFIDDLYDAGLTISARRFTAEHLVSTPYTEIFLERLTDERIDRPQILTEGLDGWAYEEPVLRRQPLAVWQDATSGDRVVVGERGLLVWYTPARGWALAPAIDTRSLRALDGPGLDNLVAVGDGGAVLRYDGVAWRDLGAPLDEDLRDVWVAGPERFVAVGPYRIVEYNQGTWTVHKVTSELHGVSGRHWEDIWAVGREGAALWRGPAGWRRVAMPVEENLHAVWLDPGSTSGYAVGANATLLRQSFGRWEPVAPPEEMNADLWAIHGRHREDVLAVGDFGSMLRFDGRVWSRLREAPEDALLLSAHAAVEGAWAAVGPRVLSIGPLLPVMRFEVPSEDDPTWTGRHLRWQTGEGAPAGATILNVVDGTGLTRWYVLAPGHVEDIRLPDLVAAAGFSPLPDTGLLRLRAQQAYWPSFDIDNLSSRAFSLQAWISWTYHYLVVDRP